jgi:excisionase family DNA binding protein
MPVDKNTELLTTAECAEELDVILRRVLQFIEEGRLKASKIAGRWFIERAELERFKTVPRKTGNLTGRPRWSPEQLARKEAEAEAEAEAQAEAE